MNLTKSAPAPEPGDELEVPSSGPSKLLLVGGGVLAAAAAGALAFVLLGGGDDVPDGPVTAAPKPAATATPAGTETASPTTSASIPTYAAKNARDPFKALVTQAAAPTGPASPTSVPSSSTTTKAPTSTKSPSKTTPPAPEVKVPYDTHQVVLDSIVSSTSVKIYADDELVTLKVGVVNGPLELVSVDATTHTATVKYGEVTITLTQSQVVLLQG